MGDWSDITLRLRADTPHLAGSPPFLRRRVLDVARSDRCNVSMMWVGSHCGTHVSAPSVLRAPERSDDGIDAMPLSAAVGPARVIDLGGARLEAARVEALGLATGERLLLRSSCGSGGVPAHGPITVSAAAALARVAPPILGVDALDVGVAEDRELDALRILLEAGIWIVAGLDLSSVPAGRYELVCLPLPVEGGEAAPARAIVRPL
jgi:arylformamidase